MILEVVNWEQGQHCGFINAHLMQSDFDFEWGEQRVVDIFYLRY